MPTLSFHTSAEAGKKIRTAARRRKVPLSNFLRSAAENAATAPAAGNPFVGLEDVFGVVNLGRDNRDARAKIRARLTAKHRR